LDGVPTHLRTILLAPSLLAFVSLVAACTAAPSATPSASPTTAGWASPVGSTPVVPKFASSELAVGPERFLFTIIDLQGHQLADPSAAVHVRFFDLAKDAEHPASETEAVFFWLDEGVRGLYRAPVTFTTAGQWGAEMVVTRSGSGPAAATDPLASPVTVRVIFPVRAHPSTPAVGDPAPPVDTPTLASAGGDPRRISTDPDPDPRLYQLSVREALAAKQPFLLNFGTPAFCESSTCGPTLKVIRAVLADFPTLAAIHVEPYLLREADGSLQPAFDASGNMQPIPAVLTWGLTTEPYTFLIDGDGKVAARLEGAIDPVELRQAITALLGG
jgi:hypothetical protein